MAPGSSAPLFRWVLFSTVPPCPACLKLRQISGVLEGEVYMVVVTLVAGVHIT